MKFIFVVLIFVAVDAHAHGRKRCYPVPTPVVDPPPAECGTNEVYSACGANGCQSTCENPTLNQVCKAVCMAGCVCKEGYLRDAKGRCVRAANCPQIEPPTPTCGANEVYSACGAHGCLSTCENPELITYCDPAPGCYPGCVCNEGYLRDTNGRCVLAANCPQIGDPPVDPPIKQCTKKYESFNNCGSKCPLTCENPTPGNCVKICVSGCFCDNGYVRNNKGNCVKLEDCPKPVVPKCGKHENYNDCGGSICQATCENPNLPMMCKAPCKPGCGCDDGYVRDNDGTCVLLKKCPQTLKCEDNEVYEACTTICGEPTCDRAEAFYCGAGCEPKCLCKSGYVRNAENKCIKPKNCPAPKPTNNLVMEI